MSLDRHTIVAPWQWIGASRTVTAGRVFTYQPPRFGVPCHGRTIGRELGVGRPPEPHWRGFGSDGREGAANVAQVVDQQRSMLLWSGA